MRQHSRYSRPRIESIIVRGAIRHEHRRSDVGAVGYRDDAGSAVADVDCAGAGAGIDVRREVAAGIQAHHGAGDSKAQGTGDQPAEVTCHSEHR